jgi:phage recombination protein Bet
MSEITNVIVIEVEHPETKAGKPYLRLVFENDKKVAFFDETDQIAVEPGNIVKYQEVKKGNYFNGSGLFVVGKGTPPAPKPEGSSQGKRGQEIVLAEQVKKQLMAEAKISDLQYQALTDLARGWSLTPGEFKTAVLVSSKRGLSMLNGQVYCVKRYNKDLKRDVMVMQTGIDGFRLIAERTGKYRGQTKPEWCDKPKEGKQPVWLEVWPYEDKHPYAARTGIFKQGFQEPLYAVARWKGYAQYLKSRDDEPQESKKLKEMWDRMDDNQILKCAEAQALRKAFPEDLGGLYTTEEMQQADSDNLMPTQPPSDHEPPQEDQSKHPDAVESSFVEPTADEEQEMDEALETSPPVEKKSFVVNMAAPKMQPKQPATKPPVTPPPDEIKEVKPPAKPAPIPVPSTTSNWKNIGEQLKNTVLKTDEKAINKLAFMLAGDGIELLDKIASKVGPDVFNEETAKGILAAATKNEKLWSPEFPGRFLTKIEEQLKKGAKGRQALDAAFLGMLMG